MLPSSDRMIQERMHAVRLARLQHESLMTPPPAMKLSMASSVLPSEDVVDIAIGRQISCWLLPPKFSALPSNTAVSTRSTLVQTSNQLARAHKLPATMEPHITLIGDVGCSAADAASRLESLKGSGPVSCAFDLISSAPPSAADGKVPWYQSCVAVVKQTPQLLALQRRARECFLGVPTRSFAAEWAPPLGVPHLSLAYAPNNELSQRLRTLSLPPPFVATTLALFYTSGGFQGFANGEWTEVGRVEL